jgi:hypothetical protein
MLAKITASDNHHAARPPRLTQIVAPFSSRLSRHTAPLFDIVLKEWLPAAG